MKIKISMFIITLCLSVSFAQKKKEIDQIKYKRNSLSTFLVTDGPFENKDKVLKAYKNYEFPDQYNDHRLETLNVDISQITFTDDEFLKILEDLGTTKDAYEQSLELKKSFWGNGYKDDRLDIYKIKKYIDDNKLGSKLVEKWYDNNADGEFDNDLIIERGLFNASKEDVDKANSSSIGTRNIIDGAALDLIPQTYMIFNKMSFVSNEIAASVIRAQAMLKVNEMAEGLPKELAKKAADKIYQKTSEGYSVWTTAFLFKLKWDLSNQTDLYTNWENKEVFLQNEFILIHEGTEKANSLVTFSLKKEDQDRSEDDVINLATVRNVEKVFSKLTKKYEEFKPKVPLAEFSPLTAFIGMKEGLEGGETFEVLNEEYDPKTGRSIYKSVGKVKVDKKSVWDNRYSLDGKPNNPSGPDRTKFKGKVKKATYGSLLRFIK